MIGRAWIVMEFVTVGLMFVFFWEIYMIGIDGCKVHPKVPFESLHFVNVFRKKTVTRIEKHLRAIVIFEMDLTHYE